MAGIRYSNCIKGIFFFSGPPVIANDANQDDVNQSSKQIDSTRA